MNRPSIHRLAVVGNAAPRRCGIATFTDDLTAAFREHRPGLELFRAAVSDRPEGYVYGEDVDWEVRRDARGDYGALAVYLGERHTDVLNVQHEFGIYGGPSGSHVLELLRAAPAPVVTTLHTVLRDPTPEQRRVTEEVARLSGAVVAMSDWARRTLGHVYGVPPERVRVIPHGIPRPAHAPGGAKRAFGAEGRDVVLTLGLLGRGKGLETVIRALPAVAVRHPGVLYLVVGATHPHVLEREGEAYREELRALAAKLGVERHLRFVNRFVTPEEFDALLAAADVYCTPYPKREQAISGTLARAVGAGCAVLSTPYWHAEELLADGRGVLFPFGDAEALATELDRLLSDHALRAALGARARAYGRSMAWPQVAERYLELFDDLVGRAGRTRPALVAPPVGLDPRHLERLSDDVGIAHHAIWTVPNFHEGYTTDDNARALQLVVNARRVGAARGARFERLADRTLAFLRHAFDAERGRFRNLLSAERRWLEPVGSENAHGRALRALAELLAHDDDAGRRGAAGWLFRSALPAVRAFTSPRAWALALLALAAHRARLPGDREANALAAELAARLLAGWRREASPRWRWFEDHLAHGNAQLAHGLLEHGRVAGDDDAVRVGLDALGWLRDLQRGERGDFRPVGSERPYRRQGSLPRFDQQPLEAWVSVDAYLAAYRADGDPAWREAAQVAYGWFLGRNDLGVPLYDAASGGCRDGLHPDRRNENQGAESTLAFWLASLALQEVADVARPTLPADATGMPLGGPPALPAQARAGD